MKNSVSVLLSLLFTIRLSSQPTIASFTPASGPVGTIVTIRGTHFDPIASQNIVYLGAIKASVSTATDTSLNVVVPISATYQPITVTAHNLTAYSNKPFIVTFNGLNSAFTSNSFLPKSDLAMGQHPYAVAAGDFDGDGKADLLIPLGGADTVSILRNTSSIGNISFAPAVNCLTTGNDNEECAAGDIDGDGKLDFIVTNGTGSVSNPTGSYSFSVFRNTSSIGNVSFAPRIDFSTSTACFFATLSDLNGDGKPDIAVANEGTNTISVFVNTSTPGNISFSSKVDFTTNAHPYFITTGDLDGDLKPDLIIMTQGSGSVLSVMRNTTTNGNISFDTNVNLASLTTWFFASIGDLDNDGKADIAATNGNSIAVLKNKCTPVIISFDSPLNLPTGNSAACISISDLNGDGKPDMLVANQASASVSGLRNTSIGGNISFDTHIDYIAGTGPFSNTIDDLDGDQRPDLITANSTVYTVSILRNVISLGIPPSISSFTPANGVAGTQIKISGSNFANVTSVSFGGVPASSFTVDSATGITATVGNGATGDVSVTTIFGTATLSGFTYNGPVITSFTPTHGVSGTSVTIRGSNFTGTTLVKFGGAPASSFTIDSSTGITAIVGAGSSGVVTVTTPNGTASLPGFIYDLPTITSFAPAFGAIGTTVTISGSNFDTVSAHNIVYFGAVKATIAAATDSTLVVAVPVGATYQPITVTANNLTAYSNKPFIVTFSGGGSAFTSNSFIPKMDFGAGNYPHVVVSGDLDGDGKTDLIVASDNSDIITVLKNTSSAGAISFAPKQNIPATGINNEHMAIGDLDGDGKLDFVLVNASSHFISLYRNTSTNGNISFAPNIDYPISSASFGVAIGDLNGDGKPDLVVANTSVDTICVYRNASTPGNFSFDTRTDFYARTFPYSVAINDLDGDGKPDLAIITQGASQSLSVMRNTSTGGSISFASKLDLATIAGPFIVSIGDLDGDGKPDLAATNFGSNTVTVSRNLSTPGNISFAPKIALPTGKYPICVSISDMNGDGKADLVTTNGIDSSVSVLKNMSSVGSISFATHFDYAISANPFYLTISDLDNDGRPDITVAASSGNTVSILKNIIGVDVAPTITSFTPTFGINGMIVKISGSNFTGAVAVSFGGIPAASYTVDSSTGITATVGLGATGNVNVTTSYGTATRAGFVYGLPATITSFSPTSGPTGVMVTIKGSHFDTISSRNIVYFGAVKATVSAGTDSTLLVTVPVGATYQPITVTANNLTAYSDGPFIVTFPNDGGPYTSNSFTTKIDFGSGNYPHSVASGDFDGDGKADLLVARGSSDSVTIFKNTSSAGNISFAPKLNFPAQREQEGSAIADLDGDGKLDFAIVNGVSSYTVSVYRNTSTNGNISFAPKIDYPTENGPYSVAIRDLNGDGKPELVVSNTGSNIISIYKNLSAPGNILFDTKIDLSPGTNPYSVSTGDMDGDGKPDLAIMTQGSSSSLSVMRNTGTGGNISFGANIQIATLDGPFIASIGDLDGDGKPDLAASSYNSVAILRNLSTIGNIAFDTKRNFSTGNYVACVSMGDLDGDGKPDIVTSNWLDNNISLLKNNSTVGNIGFDNQVLYPVDANPYYVAISDFDGDSKPVS